MRDQGSSGIIQIWTEGREQLVGLQSSLRSPGWELLISHSKPRSQVHFSSFRFLLQINVLEGFAHPALLIHFPVLPTINLSLDDNVAPAGDLKCRGKQSNRHQAALMSLLAVWPGIQAAITRIWS